MWVARNKNGTVWLYIDKPVRSSLLGRWEVYTEKSLLRADDCMEIYSLTSNGRTNQLKLNNKKGKQ